MDDHKCSEVYERLLKILKDSGLTWVSAQVEEQVRLGKTVEREIDLLREDKRERTLFDVGPFPISFKKGARAKFPVTIEHSPSERLLLIMDAMEQAIVNTAEMEHHITGVFEAKVKEWKEVMFFSGEGDAPITLITPSTTFSRLKGCKSLKQSLDSLRKEI